VAEIKSFLRKSAYRTSVWGHPHLLGYIEVGEIVRPVITRDDFVRNKNRNIFYEAILGLEEEIKNALDRINEAQRDTTLNRLEDVLRDVLESIARQDRRQLRLYTAAQRKSKSGKARSNVAASSNEIRLVGSGGASDGRAADTDVSNSAADNPDAVEQAAPPELAEADGTAPQGNESAQNIVHRPTAPVPGPDDAVEFRYDDEKVQKPGKPVRRRRSFDIQFYDIPPDAEGQVKRSYLVDATIYINVGHPDFQDRMIYTRQGQPKVTDRLGAYIAATVSIHYKDQFYAKYGYMPDRRDLLFDEQVDFIFRLEAALREHLPALERELAEQKRQNEVEIYG
jgi:hypothetical protein